MRDTAAIENSGFHIDRIMAETTCRDHSANHGEACWYIPSGSLDTLRAYPALCGRRIKRAGFNGTVTSTSTRQRLFSGSASLSKNSLVRNR